MGNNPQMGREDSQVSQVGRENPHPFIWKLPIPARWFLDILAVTQLHDFFRNTVEPGI